MPIPTGQVSFSDIAQELGVACENINISDSTQFGLSAPHGLGELKGCSISPPVEIEYLVIAGGGGGGYGRSGGGGGAGGYRSSIGGESSGGGCSAETSLYLTIGTAYSVTIGAGGVAGSSNGSNSLMHTITSIGGGRGGSQQGGSGGGGSGSTKPGGSGTLCQGFNGGSSLTGGSLNCAGGGGGGAGEPGQNAYLCTLEYGGKGGNGVSSSITGSAAYRAGGGGGGTRHGTGIYADKTADGGLGGGGNGAACRDYPTSGQENTGSGGGGGSDTVGIDTRQGCNGGSGVVILRYPNTVSLSPGAGLTTACLNCAVGSCKYTCIIGGTGNVCFV